MPSARLRPGLRGRPRSPLRLSALPLPALPGVGRPPAGAPGVGAADAMASSWPDAWVPVASQDPVPVAFAPPAADDCRQAPTVREVPGRDPQDRTAPWPEVARHGAAARRAGSPARREAERFASSPAVTMDAAPAPAAAPTIARPAPPVARMPSPRPPDRRPVTAGVVDDNADFGAYLAYRARQPNGLLVRDRDVQERYALVVTDAAGHPVHDAEVAVQRAGVPAPVAWARTDTAGRAWLHPRAFLAGPAADAAVLGVAVRKGDLQARAVLTRGQAQAVQVRLDGRAPLARPRLDLVFLVDATGSMDDEIAKLKDSMQAMARQIAQLPGRPDICYGLVAYRDHGDAFVTRTHALTHRLDAFRQVLGEVEAGGGGDTPEALDEALGEAVHGLAWRRDAVRLVVLVADAPAHADRHGGPRYDVDMQAALAKGIKLLPVGASGLDPSGEYVFRQLAQYTAGRFVFLTYRDAADPGSGPGTATVHDVNAYSVDTLDRLVVRLVGDELARLPKA